MPLTLLPAPRIQKAIYTSDRFGRVEFRIFVVVFYRHAQHEKKSHTVFVKLYTYFQNQTIIVRTLWTNVSAPEV